MTTELQWHKANPKDLPELNNDGESRELIFIVKEDEVWSGTRYYIGYFDNSLRFFARHSCEYINFNKVSAWAYLPDDEES